VISGLETITGGRIHLTTLHKSLLGLLLWVLVGGAIFCWLEEAAE